MVEVIGLLVYEARQPLSQLGHAQVLTPGGTLYQKVKGVDTGGRPADLWRVEAQAADSLSLTPPTVAADRLGHGTGG
eukprot:56072-Eustigmatos_ZCMA.PRE.1